MLLKKYYNNFYTNGYTIVKNFNIFKLIEIIYFFINEVKLTKYKLKITFSLFKEISIYEI